jgi:hypothetical protein
MVLLDLAFLLAIAICALIQCGHDTFVAGWIVCLMFVLLSLMWDVRKLISK